MSGEIQLHGRNFLRSSYIQETGDDITQTYHVKVVVIIVI